MRADKILKFKMSSGLLINYRFAFSFIRELESYLIQLSQLKERKRERQTNRQTDRQTEISGFDPACKRSHFFNINQGENNALDWVSRDSHS